MPFLHLRARPIARAVRRGLLRRAEDGNQLDQTDTRLGRRGRRRVGKIALWSVSLAGSGALLVVVLRMIMAALLVTPVASGAVISKAPVRLGSGDHSPTSHPGSISGASSTATSSPVSCRASVCPVGVPGSWAVSFDDEFDGTSLDPSKWAIVNGQHANGVTALASNVTVTGGCLVLTLSDPRHGAEVNTAPSAGAGQGGYLLPVGSYAEARLRFPGDGTSLYNWPAWWTSSGPAWPAGGEIDIAEGMNTLWTVYHGDDDARYGASIPGTWSNEFHVYGVYRAADHADVYWDGTLIASYDTADNGAGQGLLVTLGNGQGGMLVPGPASQVKVDYVRAWTKAG
jgi:hypothetical protein